MSVLLNNDDFLGQLIATITRQLSASSSALFLRNDEPDFLTLETDFLERNNN